MKGRIPDGVAGLTRVMEELLGLDDNMPVAQALIFLFVAAREEAPGVGEIAERLKMEGSRVSRNLNTLEDRGLVQRIRDPHRAQAKRVVLTPAGADFRDRLSGFFAV